MPEQTALTATTSVACPAATATAAPRRKALEDRSSCAGAFTDGDWLSTGRVQLPMSDRSAAG